MSDARRPHLRPGDRVVVVAPSGPVPADRLEAGCAWLRTLGLDVVTGKHVQDRDGYLAGNDADRAADLHEAWCDASVAGVLCARGGYGATRLLPLLDWDALAAAGPKLLHGSSDVTALHGAFAGRVQVSSTFGPMPAGAVIGDSAPDAASTAGLEAVWFGGAPVTLTGRTAVGGAGVTGVLTGGNLSMLTATLGTPYETPRLPGAVVLLEDVNEQPYRLDRMLTQLRQSGWFDGVAGVVLGQFTGCGDAEPVLLDRLADLDVPILAGVDVGHGRPQLTVQLGVPVDLDPARATLTVP